MKTLFCIFFLSALAGSVSGEELSYPFETGEQGAKAQFDVKPGCAYRLDYEWREVDVPRRAYLMPHLRVVDTNGAVVLDRNVGMIQHRAFAPDDPSVQRWQVMAIVNDADRPASTAGFEGLATVKLPAGSARMTLSVSRFGEAAKVADERLRATPVSGVPRARCQFPALPPVSPVSEAELDAALSARARAVATLRPAGDRTELLVDGRRVMPKIYKGDPWGTDHSYRCARVFGENGFNVFTVSFSLSDAWRADGSVDASPVRAKLRRMLSFNPRAMILLEMGVKPRAGWGEDHPDEVFRCESGKYGIFWHGRIRAFADSPRDDPSRQAFAVPSYASAVYADEASSAIERAFREIETWPESKAVIGVYVNGGTDGQWLDLFDNSALPQHESADYSAASRRGFDDDRRQRGKPAVPIPTTAAFCPRARADFGEHADTPESEWREFYVRSAARMRLKFARAVKVATSRRILVGGYSPNAGLAGYALFAQTCAKWLLKSRDFDFFAVVPSYVREPFDPVVSAAYNASLVRNGKLLVSELDLRSGDVENWGFWGSDFWRANHTAETFRKKALHYVCHALTRGGTYHAYDMDGGWFNTPAAQETWRLANAIADRARPMPWLDDRVAVVAGERFMDHRSQGYGHMLAYAMREMPRIALAVSGVPYDFYLVDDVLADDAARLPKVILFTDLSTVGHGQYRELRRRYAKDGRVLVWFWRPGVYAADGAEIDADLGMVRESGGPGRWIVADGTSDDPLMRGVSGLFTAWYPYYADGIVYPDAWVPRGWKSLARFSQTDIPAVSVRRSGGCTEVHIANPGQIPETFIRNLVREAGFSPLVETGDITGYGSGLFYILSQSEGVKRFRLPAGRTAGETLYGPACMEEGDGYAVSLKRNQVFVLEVK